MKLPALILFLSLSGLLSATPFTLGEALSRVEAGHPWFRTRESLAELARTRQAASTARSPAEVSLEVENVFGSGGFRGTDGAETTLQFTRALDWAARRAGRVQTAIALGDVEHMWWEEHRRGLLAEAARRFIYVAKAQTDLELARQHTELAAQMVAAVQARANQAAASTGDLARARLAHTEAQLDREHAEHLLLSARKSLAAMWGGEEAEYAIAADLDSLPILDSYPQLLGRLAAAPTQSRLAAQLRWRQAQEALARSNAARGNVRWNAGLRRVEATDDVGFVFGLDYAWPSTPLVAMQTAEARAERDRTAAEAASAMHEVRATLFVLWQELNHARIEHDAVRDEMIPSAREWLASVEKGATSGRYGVHDVLEARAALFAAQRRQAKAAADYHLNFVAIEQMLGGPATL